jgi:PAS domain S-box-containing protein
MAEETIDTFDEERQLDVLRHCPAACAIARWRDRRFVDVNRAFTQLLGWARDEIVGRTAAELRLMDGGASEQLAAQLEGFRELRDRELTLRTRSGEQRHVVVAADLVSLHGEQHTITMFVDITAQKTSETRYRALFEASPEGILLGNRFDTYIDANPAICRMLGYTRDELLTMRSSDVVLPADRRRMEDVLDRIERDGIYRGDWTFGRKDGSEFQAEVIGAMLPDGIVIGLIRDVTAQRQSESRFRRLMDSNAQGVSFWKADGSGCPCSSAPPRSNTVRKKA